MHAHCSNYDSLLSVPQIPVSSGNLCRAWAQVYACKARFERTITSVFMSRIASYLKQLYMVMFKGKKTSITWSLSENSRCWQRCHLYKLYPMILKSESYVRSSSATWKAPTHVQPTIMWSASSPSCVEAMMLMYTTNTARTALLQSHFSKKKTMCLGILKPKPFNWFHSYYLEQNEGFLWHLCFLRKSSEMSYGHSSIRGMFTQHAQDLGFHSQHHIHWVCSHTPKILVLRR